MDNGKSVDAENPRFLWIYRLIFLTSSSHFPPVRSDSTVGVKYYQIITGIFLPSVSFHGCRKRLQVSKAQKTCLLGGRRSHSAELKVKLVWLSPPCSLVQIMCTDVSGIVSWEPRFPLYPCPKFLPRQVACATWDLFREEQEEHQSQLQFWARNSRFLSRFSHRQNHTPLHISLGTSQPSAQIRLD